MRGSNSTLCRVGVAAILLLASCFSIAEAQFLSDQIADADGERLFHNPSPRLSGMGLLGIAVEDENNEINLFDYVGSPVGLLADRDSISVDFQYDFARDRTDWRGVDPWAYSPAGPLWPNFIGFGGADLQTRFSFQKYNLLAAYRDRENLAIGTRVGYVRSDYATDVTKFDVSYITAVGEEDDAVPDTLFLGEVSRDSVSDVTNWVLDVIVDKEINESFHFGGHAIFSFDDVAPEIFHSPDSVTIQITRPVVVDSSITPPGAMRLRAIPNPSGDAKGAGGGLAFSYGLGDYVTLGASGDIFATNETIELRGPFFHQEMYRNTFIKTTNVHSLFKLGDVLEGAVKHQSKNMDGDGSYFWSFGCPKQGGDFDRSTVEGKTADRSGWEERTGTRWLVRVPETSIRLAVEYQDARGEFEVRPDSSYGSDSFVVPDSCSFGEQSPQFPRYAVLMDEVATRSDFDRKTFSAGASLTLWFGRRPLTMAAEYQDRRRDVVYDSGGSTNRDLSLVKLGSEVGITGRIKVRAGGVWGKERIEPAGEMWDESILTLGGTYVLVPGLRHIEVAYMYKKREPDFDDSFARDTVDHRLTLYARVFF